MYSAPNHGLIAGSARDLVPFVLHRPTTVAEAVALLDAKNDDIVLYAGGTDLCAAWREGKAVSDLVWLKGIGGLADISVVDDALHIGAMVTHHQGVNHDALKQISGLREAWSKIATVRVRFAATIGGNLMARQTSHEMAILLVALNARLSFSSPGGVREIEAASLFEIGDYGSGLLTHIAIPLKDRPVLDYERALRPTMTQALGLWRGEDGQNRGRVVMATRYLPPQCLELNFSADDIVSEALAALPEDYQDPSASNAYLRQVGGVFLRRQLSRLGAAR